MRHTIGLLTRPGEEWKTILKRSADDSGMAVRHTFLFAAIPAVCAYIGTTQVGWTVGGGSAMRLTDDSALLISVLYYVTLVVGVFSVAYMMHWMAATYGAKKPFARALVLASYIPTPLFLIGALQIYPVVWLNLVLGLPALALTIMLLYTGIPTMMEIPEERGFLFSSAVLAVGLVLLVALLATTVILWGFGLGPAFVSQA